MRYGTKFIGTVHAKFKMLRNPHAQAIQDVDEFVTSSDLEKYCITSLAAVNGCRQNESLLIKPSQ